MTRQGAASLFVGSLVLAACSLAPDSGAPTTGPTDPPAPTVASPTTTLSPTSTDGEARPLDTIGCEGSPPSVAIVCEAFDLIQSNYVDQVSADTLAEAASASLAEIDPADSDQPLVCPLPTDAFRATCDTAARLGLDSPGTAEAIVAGMVGRALDPNSAYFDPDSLALLDQEDEGEIEGIGALVSAEDQTIPGENKQCSVISETCQIVIISTIGGAPADIAELQRDDVMVAVDGEPIIGWTVDEVTSRVRGPSGTPVTLTLRRAGQLIEATMVRAAVRIPVLETEQVGDTGYIRLYVFSDRADEAFEQAVIDALAEGVERLVIDLRDNPGGLLDTAIEITSVFLDDGAVVVTESPDDRQTYPVSGGAIVPDEVEVYFVVNKASASASEVVSAVLQERRRATVVGENTFGKNTVQQRFGLSNGGALRLTIARWLTPGGLDFGGVGVTPDVEIELNGDLEAAAVIAAVLDAA
jgi:carboxyl-terminal processing protease